MCNPARLGTLLLACAACNTVSFSVTRQALYPAKDVGCHVEWLNIPASTLVPMNPDWEWVGSVSFGQMGQVSLDAALRQRVEAEACKLGGDAVSLGTSMTSEGLMATGSGTMIMVLRKKGPSGSTKPVEHL